eukprot:3567081-Lingulodinium_polyedra.AAC.1
MVANAMGETLIERALAMGNSIVELCGGAAGVAENGRRRRRAVLWDEVGRISVPVERDGVSDCEELQVDVEELLETPIARVCMMETGFRHLNVDEAAEFVYLLPQAKSSTSRA